MSLEISAAFAVKTTFQTLSPKTKPQVPFQKFYALTNCVSVSRNGSAKAKILQRHRRSRSTDLMEYLGESLCHFLSLSPSVSVCLSLCFAVSLLLWLYLSALMRGYPSLTKYPDSKYTKGASVKLRVCFGVLVIILILSSDGSVPFSIPACVD